MPAIDEEIDPDEVYLVHLAGPMGEDVATFHDAFKIGDEWVEGEPYTSDDMKYMMIDREYVVSVSILDKEDFEGAMEERGEGGFWDS